MRNWVDTEFDVVNLEITYDSKYCIAIVNDRDEHFEVQGYSLSTYEMSFSYKFRGTYIKMNQVEQNNDGTLYCLAY